MYKKMLHLNLNKTCIVPTFTNVAGMKVQGCILNDNIPTIASIPTETIKLSPI